MSKISALKNKISRLKIKIIKMEDTFTFKCIAALDKEIIELKQEGQCKQVSIDSLEYLLDSANQELENKKIRNRIKKLFLS